MVSKVKHVCGANRLTRIRYQRTNDNGTEAESIALNYGSSRNRGGEMC